MEKIISIVETTFKQQEKDWCDYDGFLIHTDKQVIKLGISNGQSCCENWGYLMSEDDVQSFVGAELLSIKAVDVGVNEKCIDAGNGCDEGGAMFINLETSNGLLQFVAYNGHNGYYSHSAFVESTFLSEEVSL